MLRVKKGPPGPSGKNAVELQSWCPTGILSMFRTDEECTYYFNTKIDGLLYDRDKVIGLKDRFGNNNAICLQNFHKPEKIGKFYGISLEESLYKISNVETATTPPSICVIALQFKVAGVLTDDKKGYICCNETLTRGVTITKSNLNILGTDPMQLIYHYKDWNTLIIQYSNITEDNDGKCFFILNNRRGYFTPHKNIVESKDLYIGGKKEKESFARVVLANFEVYWIDSPLPDPYLLPESILNLIQNDMDYRTPVRSPPSRKKTKNIV